MVDERVSRDLKQFILKHFQSIEEVDVLLLLYREPDRDWTAAALNQAMTSSTSSIEKRLSDLCASKLAECRHDGKLSVYRYRRMQQIRDALVDELARLYPELRLRVAQIIFEAPVEQMRNFADAFKLTEDKDRG